MRQQRPSTGRPIARGFVGYLRWIETSLRIQRRLSGSGRTTDSFVRALRSKCRRRERIRKTTAFALLGRSGILVSRLRSSFSLVLYQHLRSPLPARVPVVSRPNASLAPASQPAVRAVLPIGGRIAISRPSPVIRFELGIGTSIWGATPSRAPTGSPGPHRRISALVSVLDRWRTQATRNAPPAPGAAALGAMVARRPQTRKEQEDHLVAGVPDPLSGAPRDHSLCIAGADAKRPLSRWRGSLPTSSAIAVPGKGVARRGSGRRSNIVGVGLAPSRLPIAATRLHAPAPASIDAPISRTRRVQRSEHALPSVAFGVTRRPLPRSDRCEVPWDTGPANHPPARPNGHRRLLEATVADLEVVLTAKMERKVDKQIVAALKNIHIDSDYSRRMTDHIYATLYDRMVLEKERLG